MFVLHFFRLYSNFIIITIIIGKLHMQPMDLEPTTFPSIPLWWAKEVPVEWYSFEI